MKNVTRILLFACLTLLLNGHIYGQSGSDTTNLVFNSANSFYSAEAGEKIDLTTGRLSLTAVDLHLPGRNGLDVTISRFYKSRTNHDQNAERVLSLTSTLGMGWQCYVANFWDLRASNNSFKGLLNWRDGSNYTFYLLHADTLVCREKPEWRITYSGNVPVLTTEDGTKYVFGVSSGNQYIWYKPVTQIKDVHGNYITLTYKPGTVDLDSIIDTGNRVTKFHWSNIVVYQGIPINKLDSIVVTGFENYGNITYNRMKVNYSYQQNTFVDLENYAHYNVPSLTKVSKTLWVNYHDTVHTDVIGYQYGNSVRPANDSADIGQLTRIIYPSGGYIQYHYWATKCQGEGISSNVWTTLGSKGYSNLLGIGKDSLLTYKYLSRTYSMGGQTGGYTFLTADYPYFDKITVKNKLSNEYKINHFGKSTNKTPLDSVLEEKGSNGNLLRMQVNVWEQPTLAQLGLLRTIRSPRLKKESKYEYGPGGEIMYVKEHNYFDVASVFDISNFNYNLDTMVIESNSKDNKKRKTIYHFLHNQKPEYASNGIYNKTTLRKILDATDAYNNIVIAIDSSQYDTEDKINNNFVPANYDLMGSLPYPGDMNASFSLENGTDYIVNKYFYDYYGNMVKHQDPLGNEFTYNYGVLPGYPYQIYQGLYLLGKFNPEYGLTKGYDYHPLTGWVKSTYDYAKKPADPGQVGINYSYGGVVINPPAGYYVKQTKYRFDAIGRLTHVYLPDDFFSPTVASTDEPSLYYEYYDRGVGTMLPFNTADPSYPCVVEHKRREKGTGNEYSPVYYVYDPNGRLVQTQRPLNINTSNFTVITTSYENHGLKLVQTKPYFATVTQPGRYNAPSWNSLARDSFAYDQMQRLVMQRNAAGTASTYAYDIGTVTITDENGNTTKQYYDPFGNLSGIKDANGQTTGYVHDLLGRLSTIDLPGPNNCDYQYDMLGRLTQVANPDLGGKSLYYDAAGNLLFMQDGNEEWTYYKYDRNGRLLSTGVCTNAANGNTPQYSAPATVNFYDNYDGLINETMGDSLGSWINRQNLPDSICIRGLEYNIIPENGLLSTTVASGRMLSGWSPPGSGGGTGINENPPGYIYILDNTCFYNYNMIKLGSVRPSDTTYAFHRMLFKAMPQMAGVRAEEINGAYICLNRVYGNEGSNIIAYRLPSLKEMYYSTQDSVLNNWNLASCTWNTQPAYVTLIDTGFGMIYDELNATMLTQDLKDSFDIGPWVRGWLNNDYCNNGIMLHDSSNYAEYWSHTTSHYPERPYINYHVFDTTACTIEAMPRFPDENSMIVSWHTNELTTGEVQFSTDNSFAFRAVDQELSFDHEVTIEGLMPGTVYNMRIRAIDRGQNETFLRGYQFRTQDLTTWQYYTNGQGRLTATVSGGDTTIYCYDLRGRVLATEIKRGGRSYLTKYGYDCQGNLTVKVVKGQIALSNMYNDQGQLSGIYADGTQLSSYTYNAAGACSTETFGNGVNSVYSYYPRQWLKNAATAKGTTPLFKHAYSYDNNGNLTQDQDNTGLSSSIIRNYQYDGLNRLIQEYAGNAAPTALAAAVPGAQPDAGLLALPDPGYSISYAYDAMGNRTGSGLSYYPGTNRLQTANGATHSYDGNGNLANDGVWNYQYNYLGKLTRLSQGSGNSTTRNDYIYNAEGLRTSAIKTVTVSGGTDPQNEVDRVEVYDDLLASAPTGDGHDDARDLGKIKVHINERFLVFKLNHKYLYGTNQGSYENIYISLDTDQQMGSGSEWFPDSTNVRVSADHAWEYCIYVYDETHFGIYTSDGFKLEQPKYGNRKMKVDLSGQNDGHIKIKIPLELVGEPEHLSFVVMTSKPGAQSYNIASACDVAPGGRLAMEGNLVTQANDYNAPPRPGTTKTTVTAEGYLYDNDGNLMADLDAGGNVTKRYIYGLGGKHLALQVPNGSKWKTYYYHDDYLGSPRVMTDSSGNVIWRQDYYAFGSDYNGTATGNSHKFTGHVQDGATGQYYAKARFFTTQLGRWSQPEPLLKVVPAKRFLLNPQKLNPYIYCANNPVIYADPNGLDFILLNRNRNGTAVGYGHNGALVGNDKDGWKYYSKDGKTGGGNKTDKYASIEEWNKKGHGSEYDRSHRVTTTAKQDADMKAYGDKWYNLPYSTTEGKTSTGEYKENCADLTYGIGHYGGVDINKPKTLGITDPNEQFDYVAGSKKNDQIEQTKDTKAKAKEEQDATTD